MRLVSGSGESATFARGPASVPGDTGWWQWPRGEERGQGAGRRDWERPESPPRSGVGVKFHGERDVVAGGTKAVGRGSGWTRGKPCMSCGRRGGPEGAGARESRTWAGSGVCPCPGGRRGKSPGARSVSPPPSGRFTWRRKGPLFRRSAVVGAGDVGPVALGHQGPFERQVP